MTTPTPAPGAPAKAEDDGADEFARAVRWVTASKDARDAIKWLATAIGAAAAVAFGAGPVLATTARDITRADWWFVLVYIVAAVVGALAAAFVVWTLLRALVPRALTLDQVPQSLIDVLNRNPETSYPGNIQSWDRFVLRITACRRAAETYRERAATAATPAEKTRWNDLADARKRDLQRLRRAEATILERAGYEATTKAIDGLKWPVAGGITVAVVCVAVIQLLLSGPEPAGPDALGMLLRGRQG